MKLVNLRCERNGKENSDYNENQSKDWNNISKFYAYGTAFEIVEKGKQAESKGNA